MTDPVEVPAIPAIPGRCAGWGGRSTGSNRTGTIVSVVTRGVSDDCNSCPVDGAASEGVQLRISRLGPAFAFHARTGGDPWQLVRYFALPLEAEPDEPDEPEVGLLAQSPVGDGCTVRFNDIGFAAERLTDLRGGG